MTESFDHSITITKTGDSTRIEYNGQTFIPYHFSNEQIREAVAYARADEREKVYANLTEQGYVPVSMITDEREKIAQAIEADPLPEYEEVAYRDGFDAGQYRAARIARNGGQP